MVIQGPGEDDATLDDEWAVVQNCSRIDAVKIGKRQAEERGGAAAGWWYMDVEKCEGAQVTA